MSSTNGKSTTNGSGNEIALSKFIVERVKQLGVTQVFGVPGDYNLQFLDYIENDDQLHWVGNANELNSAYAADGYARLTKKLGVLVTTFGVGELSAMNGIAGSMAERLPILHIVGTPSTRLQGQQAILHHTLGTGNFSAFQNMAAELSAAMAILKPGGRWTEEIDRILVTALNLSKPVYLALPTDFIHAKVPAESLKRPLPEYSPPPLSPHDIHIANKDPKAVLDHVVREITTMFEAAEHPIVVVDVCTDRFGCASEIRKLVEGTGVRFFETAMGKSTVDEQHPQFGGIYCGQISLQAVRDEVESSDFVLLTGKLDSDFNSAGFTFKFPQDKTVELHSYATKIGYAIYEGQDMRTVLPLLTKSFIEVAKKQGGYKTPDPRKVERSRVQRQDAKKVPSTDSDGPIVHDWLWPRMGEFFEEKDAVIAETGTACFGIVSVPLPSHATFSTAQLWGSIGWATGATLGTALGARESDQYGRVILFTGDGSLQMTVQAVGTMLRNRVCPYIFILNNDGYEIERQLWGPEADYNDIQMYDWQLMLPFFAGEKTPKSAYESFVVKNQAELNELLNDPEFQKPTKLRVIEMYMPKGDIPAHLKIQAKLTAEANARV